MSSMYLIRVVPSGLMKSGCCHWIPRSRIATMTPFPVMFRYGGAGHGLGLGSAGLTVKSCERLVPWVVVVTVTSRGADHRGRIDYKARGERRRARDGNGADLHSRITDRDSRCTGHEVGTGECDEVRGTGQTHGRRDSGNGGCECKRAEHHDVDGHGRAADQAVITRGLGRCAVGRHCGYRDGARRRSDRNGAHHVRAVGGGLHRSKSCAVGRCDDDRRPADTPTQRARHSTGDSSCRWCAGDHQVGHCRASGSDAGVGDRSRDGAATRHACNRNGPGARRNSRDGVDSV